VDRVEAVDFTISKNRGFCVLRGFITPKLTGNDPNNI